MNTYSLTFTLRDGTQRHATCRTPLSIDAVRLNFRVLLGQGAAEFVSVMVEAAT